MAVRPWVAGAADSLHLHTRSGLSLALTTGAKLAGPASETRRG
jgi:hypothetical protein